MTDERTKITIKNNGSIKLEGNFDIFDVNGNKFDLDGKTSISLCRCGHSANKPFCDGAHSKCGFESTVSGSAAPAQAHSGCGCGSKH